MSQENPSQLFAKATGTIIGCAYMVATHNNVSAAQRLEAERKITESFEKVQGNRHRLSSPSWEDLRLVMLNDLKNAIEILETVRPEVDQNQS
jgi:hypothetical protein